VKHRLLTFSLFIDRTKLRCPTKLIPTPPSPTPILSFSSSLPLHRILASSAVPCRDEADPEGGRGHHRPCQAGPGEGLMPHRAVGGGSGAGCRAVGFPAASGLVGHGITASREERRLDWNELFVCSYGR
jgi:hypothetical protein